MADALLHGEWQEQFGCGDQCRADPDTPRGDEAVYRRERLVREGGRQDRLDRERQARRPHGAERRLLQRAGRIVEAPGFGLDDRRWTHRSQHGRGEHLRALITNVDSRYSHGDLTMSDYNQEKLTQDVVD